MARRRYKHMTADEILAEYQAGRRKFHEVNVQGQDFRRANLTGASFLNSNVRGANFANSILTSTQFKMADAQEANFSASALNATDLIGADFTDAKFHDTDFTGATLTYAKCIRADMRQADLASARLTETDLTGARLDRAKLFHTVFSNVDTGPFCGASKIRHEGWSVIDVRTVIRSYEYPKFEQFMLDCGIPPIFVEYMIDCARATGDSFLRSLMQSTFISYGGPDEKFAQKLYDSLKSYGVVTFFFPVSATVGERIDNEIFRRLQEHDRILLICSQNSLDRPGVLHEIQETLDREARDGGATYLLPVTLDDYVFAGWRTTHPELAERVGRRVVGDFRGTFRSKAKFDAALGRLLDALKVKRVVI